MNYFFENLKFLRSINKISQYSLAESIGVSRANVGSWEEGRATPNLDKLILIANIFSITIDDLISTDLRKKDAIKISQKNAQVNAQVNAQISSQNLPSTGGDSFKQPVNEPPPECPKCLEKDKTIEALQQTVRTQADYIDLLKEKIDMLTGKPDCEQKRKAG